MNKQQEEQMHSKRNIERSSINRRETRICKKEKKNHKWKLNHLPNFLKMMITTGIAKQ